MGVDAGEFEAFFRDMHPRLARYAKRQLDPDTALDVASQTMETIWAKGVAAPADDTERRRLQILAYRIVQGNIRNALRAQGRASEPVMADDDSTELLEKLSITDREVLALVADGYGVAEISLILDCPPAAVGKRLQRAKRNLKLILGRRVQRD